MRWMRKVNWAGLADGCIGGKRREMSNMEGDQVGLTPYLEWVVFIWNVATFWWPVGKDPTCSKEKSSLFTNIVLKFIETEGKTVVSRGWGERVGGFGLMTAEFQFGKVDVLEREGGEG